MKRSTSSIILAAIAAVVVATGCCNSMSPQDRLTVNDKKINEIIAPVIEDGTVDKWIVEHSEKASALN